MVNSSPLFHNKTNEAYDMARHRSSASSLQLNIREKRTNENTII